MNLAASAFLPISMSCFCKAVRRVIAVFYRRVDNLYIGRRQFFCGERKPPVSDVFANGEPAQNAEDFLKIEWRNVRLSKENGAKIKSFAPVRIKLTLEGGTVMEYRIVEKASFTIFGKCRKFNADTSYAEIPYVRFLRQMFFNTLYSVLYALCPTVHIYTPFSLAVILF